MKLIIALLATCIGCVDLELANPNPPELGPELGDPVAAGPAESPTSAMSPSTPESAADAGATPPSAGAPSPQEPKTVTVTLKNLAFVPTQVTVRVGDTVKWAMQDPGEVHYVAEGTPDSPRSAFLSPKLTSGQSWSRTFTQPGTWVYYCPQHPKTMLNAQIVVLP